MTVVGMEVATVVGVGVATVVGIVVGLGVFLGDNGLYLTTDAAVDCDNSADAGVDEMTEFVT